MASSTVRVKGLRETVRAFNKLDRTVARDITKELRKVGEPVAESGRGKISRYAGVSLGTIKPRTRGGDLFVAQNAKKRSGKRPDFGRLQQKHLEAALGENEREVVAGLEDFLDRITNSEGF